MIVIQILRAWIDREGKRHPWLLALSDPQIGRALQAIHRHPDRPWTVADLGREAGLSRSPFSARFMALLGEPPMRYVTRWRLRTAHLALQRASVPLAELAEEVGYRSEAAFCRAFKQMFGVSPGQVRRSTG